ncbi:Urease accessory protein UreF [Helicobacter heilmannii]|uniref:urease accessory protein UreF n=1 Tax=Helicobacter heilmannii TaxID=35817 RepID=UPI0006A1EE7E|nr:urease accessory protein UreF [Helicobacter heilmannii]CRF49198.1 Urease accessory protein UreF [Helicobacter heilmannii]
MHTDFLLLQINDAVFPIGSYTHSFGLETYIQHKEVKDKESALTYLQANLGTQFLYSDLLSLKLSYQHATQGLESQDPHLGHILDIEERVCLATPPLELRSANQKLGNRFLKTILQLDLPFVRFFRAYAKATTTPTHATSYGVFCACMGIGLDTALKHYLYAQSSNMVINCVKTIPLAQNDGQRILLALQETFSNLLDTLENLDERYLCAASIQNDIKAMQHEHLYSRLYMS